MHDDDDDDDEPTVIDAARRAVRGKLRGPLQNDRRAPERLGMRDWIGYAIAVLSPVIGAMLLVWQSQAVQDEKIASLKSQFESHRDTDSHRAAGLEMSAVRERVRNLERRWARQ